MQKLLVPTDGSTQALLAFAKACDIAQAFEGCQITLLAVTVAPLLDLLTQKAPQEEEKLLSGEAHSRLDEQAQSWLDLTLASQPERAGCIPIDTRTMIGHPAEFICRVAEEGNYDLVVIGSRGLSHIRRLILGSVSDYVAHNCNCSVLIAK
jgi:nucleotide-binding universal stress UspA family protein